MAKQRIAYLILLISVLLLLTAGWDKSKDVKTISTEQLRDKIAGGWAGKMIGVTYGAASEFQGQGKTFDGDLPWQSDMVEGALTQDDLYVQMTFMSTMDNYGINVSADKLGMALADAGYGLWHANRMARRNIWQGIMPPKSGSPNYSMHSDDIDFQIEADYIGFMNPGMSQSSNKMCNKVGHIMNYGDGVYGGMFVCAMYCEAFFETDIETIINKALQAIPAKSEYAECIADAIDGYKKYPDDWRKTWQMLEDKWGDDDICGAMSPFNIDAKINGAYIVTGLLYGQGDWDKTLEITTRCGQDSDCNPSNAAGVLGIIQGYSKIPAKWTDGISKIEDSLFSHTDYSFKKVIDRTLDYAKTLISKNGGKVIDNICYIKYQSPKPPKLEVSYPNLKASYASKIDDTKAWSFKGNWTDSYIGHDQGRHQKTTNEKGAKAIFMFTGTAVKVVGYTDERGGKIDVYIDGKFHRQYDCYYHEPAGMWLGNGLEICSVIGLKPGQHTLKVVVNGKNAPKAKDTMIWLDMAIVYDQKK